MEGGHALLMAILVVLLVATSMTLVSKSLLLEVNQSRTRAAQLDLVALADAALAESLARLALQPGFSGIPRRPEGRGEVEAQVTTEGTIGPTGRRVRIRIQSTVSGRTYKVDVRARLQDDQQPQVLEWRRR